MCTAYIDSALPRSDIPCTGPGSLETVKEGPRKSKKTNVVSISQSITQLTTLFLYLFLYCPEMEKPATVEGVRGEQADTIPPSMFYGIHYILRTWEVGTADG
jgi:hypothetical protein